jgi:3-deoxy-manno-octulosonate cytidylyltransferase (CMP-KDO synthetase)
VKLIGVIPARYASSRFPGKPLADILGKPMVWWVYQQAKKVVELDNVIVATDDERIAAVCREHDMPFVMTSDRHQTGTDRVAEVAEKVVADVYVSVLGDEPLIEPENIRIALDTFLNTKTVDCVILKTPYKNPVDVENRTTPKVVCDTNGYALMITRAAIPYPKATLDFCYYKPLCIYVFSRDCLLRYATLERGELERTEDIESLRFIEHGMKLLVKEVYSNSFAVDTPKDLERIRSMVPPPPAIKYRTNKWLRRFFGSPSFYARRAI